MGRDRRRLRGRGAGRRRDGERAHLRGRGPPLRDRARERPARERRHAVRGARSTASACGRRRTASSRRARCGRTPRAARRGSSSAPAAPPIRTSRRTRSSPTSTTAAARSTPCARSRTAWRTRTRRVAAHGAPARRPGLRRRGLARHARVHPLAARHERAAGRDDRRLRGVHAPVPRGVERPADPLAALHRAVGDDLRRPRRHRRLEHVDRLGARRCARPTGGTGASSAPSWPTRSTSTGATCTPDALEDDPVYRRVRDAGDGGDILAAAAFKWDREVSGVRWSYCRDVGGSRVVMIDSRAGRVLTPGERSMVDADEWRWIIEHATGGYDHLVIGTSLPLIMAPGLHYLEAWNEAVCDGAWGGLASKRGGEDPPGRRPRALAGVPRLLLRHVRAAARGRRRAGAATRRPASSSSPATCTTPTSPRSASRPAAASARASGRRPARRSATRSAPRSGAASPSRSAAPARRVGRVLARLAGVPPPPVRWRFQDGDPRFDNQVGTLELDGRRALARLERAIPAERPRASEAASSR